ncbi:MAG: PilW family protein [Pseudomonadota bacterium]
MMLKQTGLSLIELMISITLGLILLTGVMKVFLSSKTVYSTQQALSRVQETGRLAIDFMSRDIRMAGFMGCESNQIKGKNLNVINALKTPTDFKYNFVEAVYGYTAATVPSGLVPTPKALTDIIVVRSATGEGASVTATSDATNINIKVTSKIDGACGTTNRVSGFCKDDLAVVTDCVKSRVFQITDISDSGLVSHVEAGTPGNAVFDWGTETSAIYKSGAELLLVSNTVYFIAPGTSLRPSLWQKINNGTPMELLEGVENMSITYGVDTDASADLIPNMYVRAGLVTAANWKKVVSVRIELLVASIENNVIPEVQKYSFNVAANPSPIDPGDRRLRQVFTTTIGIRSRLE